MTPSAQSSRPRVAVNGFGRIGRAFTRIAALDANCPFDLVATNDMADAVARKYLLQYDTTFHRLTLPVVDEGEVVRIGAQRVAFLTGADPAKLPWGDLGIDLVIESTGRFTKRALAAAHLTAGAKRVLISAPGDGKDPPDVTVVRGINDGALRPEHTVISAASCTTTCLAPVAKALHDACGILNGTMTTVHAYTGDQALLDIAHNKDFRRGRAAAQNIVPTSTGAAKAIGLVVPELIGKLHGLALRVPVAAVSLCDLVVEVERETTSDAVNAVLAAAAAAYLPGVLRIETEPVVSSDLMGDPNGSVVDSLLTHVQGNKIVKVIAWYDNEWGYASRLYALACRILTSAGN